MALCDGTRISIEGRLAISHGVKGKMRKVEISRLFGQSLLDQVSDVHYCGERAAKAHDMRLKASLTA